MPVELNGVKLSFVLDTGVSRPILFNLVNMDSLQIKNRERSFLRGLGSNGNIQAIRSRGNIIKIGEAIAVNRDVSVIFDESINFTSRLGVPVHGIIGYDLFKDFIVEINYSSEYLRLYKRQYFKDKKKRKWKELPIEIINRKPYLNADINIDSELFAVKLLIDTGGSDALWLFEKSQENIEIPENKRFRDFLGKGLSGAVYGVRSKIKTFSVGSYKLSNVNVAFPDSSSLTIARRFKERNGSVSGNILKRFNLFFDYKNGKLLLKKNGKFNSPFYYNNSGITAEQRGLRVVKELQKSRANDGYGRDVEGANIGINLATRYSFILKPSFEVVELRENSNAKKSGVEIGDIITSINGSQTSSMTLQEVNKYFYNKKGTTLRIRVERDGKELDFKFELDDVFKKKSPQIESSN
ncbi:aspartyl protease family protein [Winogradskyella sp.]|nr:aspartyl protease family protein [Winogradskyella sp.]